LKAVIQRVLDASVSVNGVIKGEINSGLLVYLGVAQDDNETDVIWLTEKIANLRIFNDDEGRMNLSIKDITLKENQNIQNSKIGVQNTTGVLVISQFTLLADARKGRRPSWNGAAVPEKANKLYEYFISEIKKHELVCHNGEFQAHMKVTYTNDGPVTIILDTKDK